MKLKPEQENLIRDIIDTKLKNYYCYQDPDTLECITLDEKKRSELGQFYTPADICIKMINMYKTETVAGKNILDPCCGSGNLLIAMLCAGADTDKIYGNDFDADAIKICKGRIKQALKLLGRDETEFRDWQIHQGNAMHKFALTEFCEDYYKLYYGDYNTIDLDTYTNVNWLNKSDEEKRVIKGWRTKHLNDVNYNAYLGKAYNDKNQEAAKLVEHNEILSGNLSSVNASANISRQNNKDENKKISDASPISGAGQEDLFGSSWLD